MAIFGLLHSYVAPFFNLILITVCVYDFGSLLCEKGNTALVFQCSVYE